MHGMPLSPLACRAVASAQRRVPHGAREKSTFCFTKSMAPTPHDEGMGRGYGKRGSPPQSSILNPQSSPPPLNPQPPPLNLLHGGLPPSTASSSRPIVTGFAVKNDLFMTTKIYVDNLAP